MKKLHILIAMTLLVSVNAMAQGWPANYGGVMLQGFFWDSYKETPDCSPFGPWQYHQSNDATATHKPGYTWATMYGAGWGSAEEWQVPVTTWPSLLAHKDDITPFIDLLWLPQSGSTVADSTTVYYTSNDNSRRGGVRPWRNGQTWGYSDGSTITNPDCMGFVPVFYFHHGLSYNPDGTPWTYTDSQGKVWTPMSYFGTEAQLRELISTFKNEGTGAIEDVVANHRGGLGTWSGDKNSIEFPTEYYKGTFSPEGEYISWTSADVCSDDESGRGTGNEDCGGRGEWARDIDHHAPATQQKVIKFLDFLKNDLGYVGFRYDYAMGFEEKHFAEYNTTLRPTFSVGEYWGSKDNISSWIHKTYMEGTYQSAAFDFPLQSDIREAFNYGNYRYLNNSGLISDPVLKRYAVTFLDNHDTFKDLPTDGSNYNWDSGKAYNHRVEKNIVEANAFILAMPGTPCLFYPHFMHPDWHPILCWLIKARRTAGITNESERSAAELIGDNGIQWVVTGTHGQVCFQLGDATDQGVPSGFTTVWESTADSNGKRVARYSITSSLYDQIEGNNKKSLINGYPVIDRNSCTFSGSMIVNVYPSSEGCTLVYTTNGQDPQAGDATITENTTLNFTDNITLKVGVLVDGAVPTSSIVTRQYVKTATTSDKINFYVKDDNAPNFYVYYDDENGTHKPLGEWGGTHATEQVKVGGIDWWHVQMDKPAVPVNLIINWDGSQTPDITGITSDVFYTVQDGQPNDVTNTYMPMVENPSLSIDKGTGTYQGGVTATITSSYGAATIVYTTDGTEPTTSSATIASGATVTFNTTGNHYLRAAIVKDGEIINQVARSYYVENGAGETTFNGTRVFVRAESAPNLYVFNTNGAAPSSDYTEWGGKQLKKTVTDADGYTWYYASFEGLNSCSIILNNGSGSQTEDITNISGDAYIIYNGSNYYLNVTGLTSHKSYLLFEPSLNKWADAGAVMQIYVNGVGDNLSMSKIGGTNGGNPIYLWYNNETTVGEGTNICFKRKDPNNLDEQWAYANTTYTKGGYYYDDGQDWNDHVQRSNEVNFSNLKYPDVPQQEFDDDATITSMATPVSEGLYFYFENSSYGSPYAWVYSSTKTYGEHGWPGEALVEVVGTAANGNTVYRWTYPAGVAPGKIIFSNKGASQTGTFDFVNGGYYTTAGYQGTVTGNLMSLKEMLKKGSAITGQKFTLSNDLTSVLLSADGKSIIVKDGDGEAIDMSRNTEGKQVHNSIADWKYNQSNWIEFKLPQQVTTGDNITAFNNKTLLAQTIVGTVTDVTNPTITLDANPLPVANANAFEPNKYVTANFNTGANSDYYFVEPKAQEYATIEWAVYHDGKFYMPLNPEANNQQATNTVHGAVAVSSDNSYRDDQTALTDLTMYRLTVIIKRKPQAQGAPRLMAGNSGIAVATGDPVSSQWEIAIVSAEKLSDATVTPIEKVTAERELVRTIYFNLNGIESDRPFQGVNIVVREYSDGSRSASKMIK
ncbi:MAG: starch-binding protein [Muribaculaceae bacterium]|nr:starch-binding protein [Muribaculaceae bacterium]